MFAKEIRNDSHGLLEGSMVVKVKQGSAAHGAKVQAPLRQMIVCTIVASLSLPAFAGQKVARCFDEASARFGHANPDVLRAFSEVESSGMCPKRHRVNSDGSYDIGCMGINSSWLPKLQKQFGITEQALYDPCINVHVGAWVYAKNIRQFGNNWRAIGAFNARSEHKRVAYAWKINSKLNELR